MRPAFRELALMAGVFVAWQLEVFATTTRYTGAYPVGRWVWTAERALWLPSEAWLQRLVSWSRPLMWASVGFYEVAFWVVPLVVGVLLWRRDRARYVAWRNLFIASTVTAFLVACALPVAPPRLLGVASDFGVQLGVSEYRSRGVDVLSAFPSVHVVWAVLVSAGCVALGRRRLGWLYVAATVLDVIVTGNHTWFDCVGAVLLVVLVRQVGCLSARRGSVAVSVEPVGVAAGVG